MKLLSVLGLLLAGPAARADGAGGAWLGVQLRASPAGEVTVAEVLSGSPAQAVLRPGDVLLRADGVALRAPSDLVGRVSVLEPGRTLELAVRRGGEERIVRTELAPHPGLELVARRRHLGKPAAELEGLAGVGTAPPPRLSALRGKVVVLDFFAGWCAACRELAPELSRWHARLERRGLAVVGVTSDAPAEAARVASEWGIPYAVASSAAGEPDYLVPALPTTFVIDRQGVVREVFVGALGERRAAAEALLEQLLEEPGAERRGGHGRSR